MPDSINDLWYNALSPNTRGVDLAVGSIQQRWRDNFCVPALPLWDVVSSGGSTVAASQGVLTVATGTTAGGFVELVSKETFTFPFRGLFSVQTGTRQANTHHYMEFISVNDETGIPDGRNTVAWNIGGTISTTVTNGGREVTSDGQRPAVLGPNSVNTTASYAMFELEPTTEEVGFHTRSVDTAVGRGISYIQHSRIPDPTAKYKLRIRSMNHAAWLNVTGAVAGTGNVIRLTVTAHGYATSNVVWVEYLNGVTNGAAQVRGNYTITVIDANTFELQGTSFVGTYIAGSGRCALAAAPAANVNLQFQFASVQDYSEVTAEITSGRGNGTAGAALPVRIVDTTNTSGGTAVSVTPSAGVMSVTPTASASWKGRTYLNSAASTNATLIVGASGVGLLNILLSNNGASAAFFKLYDKATAPVPGTDVPVLVIPIPAGGYESVKLNDSGLIATNGWGFAITNLIADADTTAVAAGQVKVAITRTL